MRCHCVHCIQWCSGASSLNFLFCM
jgi:hypothetical protein